jgi:hypothetical protein
MLLSNKVINLNIWYMLTLIKDNKINHKFNKIMKHSNKLYKFNKTFIANKSTNNKLKILICRILKVHIMAYNKRDKSCTIKIN